MTATGIPLRADSQASPRASSDPSVARASTPSTSAASPTARRTALHGDPPSVRAILGALHARQRLTGADLREVSGLPRRTVYQALRILRERGDVQQRKSLHDTRQTYFWLVAAPGGRAPGFPQHDGEPQAASASL
ncbi:MAG: helix-turn-helix domain-containing protein [Thermoplasmatota archaeon]